MRTAAGTGGGASKTNAIRLLEGAGIAHAVHTYAVLEEHLDAVAVAAALGVEPERVFKTLVTRAADGEIFVFCVPGSCALEPKKAAAAVGARSVGLVRLEELRGLSGYQRGACSPVGMKRSYPTVIDESALVFERILVSAGRRGLQVELAPRDLAGLVGARFADVV